MAGSHWLPDCDSDSVAEYISSTKNWPWIEHRFVSLFLNLTSELCEGDLVPGLVAPNWKGVKVDVRYKIDEKLIRDLNEVRAQYDERLKSVTKEMLATGMVASVEEAIGDPELSELLARSVELDKEVDRQKELSSDALWEELFKRASLPEYDFVSSDLYFIGNRYTRCKSKFTRSRS